jgi:hypothetical protein
MPWQIWSPEDFPKRGEQGYLVDYCTAYGIQVILHANQWTELDADGFYTKSYSNSWVDKQADEKEITITAKEIAARICRDRCGEFEGVKVPVGLMYCNSDHTKEKELKELEVEGKKRNLVYRKKVVEAFETQFRVKSQGGAGRWTPNPYERECYDVLGFAPPEVVNRPAVQAPANIQIVQPDAAMISQMVAAEVEKRMSELTAPKR